MWPHKDYPLREVGKLKFDRNPTNYFAEVEQVSFSPAHMVPGIEASPDRVLQSRLFAYDDASRYRLGSNYLQVCNRSHINAIEIVHVFWCSWHNPCLPSDLLWILWHCTVELITLKNSVVLVFL